MRIEDEIRKLIITTVKNSVDMVSDKVSSEELGIISAEALLIVLERLNYKILPMDIGTREFADSALPFYMIAAGMDMLEKIAEDELNYVPGETIDWDYGMAAVAVYRAMCHAKPKESNE